MKKVLLVCVAGMSTTLLVNKLESAAKEAGVDLEILPLQVSECSDRIGEVDVVMLSPQVRFHKPQIDEMVKGRIPVEVIKPKDYSEMNINGILDRIAYLMNKKTILN